MSPFAEEVDQAAQFNQVDVPEVMVKLDYVHNLPRSIR